MRKDTVQFYKKVLKLSIPVMLQQLLNNVVNMTDTLMIGKVGELCISGVAVANKVFFIYQLILFGYSNGVGIFLSQYNGANRKDVLADIFNEGIRKCILIALLAIVICIFLQSPILSLYLADHTTLGYASTYLSILVISFIPFSLTQMYSVAFRVLGVPKMPMIAGFCSFITNVILNAILIFGLFGFPRLEVAGAAIATVIARFVEVAILMITCHKYLDGIYLKMKVDLSSKMKMTIFSKAIPLMCNELIWSIGLNIIFINYSYIDELYIPAITIVDTISNFVYVMFSGVSVAVGFIVGNGLGKGEIEKAKYDVKRLLILALAIYFIGGVILVATSGFTPFLFSLTDTNALMATILLIIKALTAWTQGYSNTVYYVLRAGGDTKSVLLIDGVFTWAGPVLISVIASRFLSLDLVFTYILVEGVGIIKVLVATYFLKKGKWIRNLTNTAEV